MHSKLLTFSVAVATCAAATAQDQAYVLTHPILNDDFGMSTLDLGDLDGDGLTEIAIGQAGLLSGSSSTGVSVQKGGLSGELFNFSPPGSINAYGFSLGKLSDLDGDGTAELIIGAPGLPSLSNDTTYVEVRSGSTGNVLRALFGPVGSAYGAAVTGCGDVDGDGTPDLAIGAPANSTPAPQTGSVFVVSGLTSSTLFQIDGTAAGEFFGRSIAMIEDQDGDGLRDLVIGASGGDYVAIHSSAGGALLQTISGPVGTRSFGYSVDDVDDYDGDGLDDVIVGAPEEDGGNGANAGAARVYSSSTGLMIYEFQGGFTGDELGKSVAGVADIDFDGVRDFGYGAPLLSSPSFFPAGFVSVRSGATGALIYNANGPGVASGFGFSITGVADFNNDGLSEVLCAAPGRAEVQGISFGQSPGTPYCFGDSLANCPCANQNDGSVMGGHAGCAGSTNPGGASLVAIGGSLASQDSTGFRITSGIPGQPGLLYQGDNAINGGAGAIFGDGLRCAGSSVVRLEVIILDAQGDGQSTQFIAAAGGVVGGETKHYQFWYRDPSSSPCGSGFNLSNGVTIDWLP